MAIQKNKLWNGYNISYSEETIFRVQSAKGKSSYQDKKIFKGSLSDAMIYYMALPVKEGSKKRLLMESPTRDLILTQAKG